MWYAMEIEISEREGIGTCIESGWMNHIGELYTNVATGNFCDYWLNPNLNLIKTTFNKKNWRKQSCDKKTAFKNKKKN